MSRRLKDPFIEKARELKTVHGREKHGALLAEGEEAVSWAVAQGAPIEFFLLDERLGSHPLLDSSVAPVHLCPHGILRKLLDGRGEMAAVIQLPKRSEGEFLIVLDDVRDPGNVGTIVRTAAAFGIHHFGWIGEPGDLWTRKAINASRGAAFSATLDRYGSADDAMHSLQGYTVVTTSPHAATPQGLITLPAGPVAVLFGNEKRGVRPELVEAADLVVQIPMKSAMESLNVGVAAGISLYELNTKRVLSMLVSLIQSSLGRNMAVTARWMRRVLDKKMQEAAGLSADEVVALFVSQCDGESSEQLAKLWPLYQEVEEQLMAGLSEEERGELLRCLEKIRENCAKEVEYDDF